MGLSRRSLALAGATGCLLCASRALRAAVLPTSLEPLFEGNYRPVDTDERGLWHACELLEEDLAASPLVLHAPDLSDYTREILVRLIGKRAEEIRIYMVRDPSFNASMAPNGMMIVHSGLLSRVNDEAQYANILGHESGHYLRKHSVERWRSVRTRTAIGAFLSAGANAAAGYAAMQGAYSQNWINLANSINQVLILSLFSFSRAQEREADAYGIGALFQAGYTPRAAAQVWSQLIDERKASAAQRDKRYRDGSTSVISTHPPSAERMRDLTETAMALEAGAVDRALSEERERWQKLITPYLPSLLDEQVKLNDPGASLYLIESHARSGWTGLLRFYEGEVYRLRDGPDDADRATAAYTAAVELHDAPAEAWRALGYARIKAGELDAGRRALETYLQAKPDARDAALVRLSLTEH